MSSEPTPIELALRAKKGEMKADELPEGAARNLFKTMSLSDLEAAAVQRIDRKPTRFARPFRFIR